MDNTTCCYQYCKYIEDNNLCYNCDHPEGCQCHKSRDILKEELDVLKKKLKTEKAYRANLSNEISNLIKKNNALKTAIKEYQDEIIQKNNALDIEKEYRDEIIQKNNALDIEKEYRYELMKTNTSLEVGLITAYIIISILFALLMLK